MSVEFESCEYFEHADEGGGVEVLHSEYDSG